MPTDDAIRASDADREHAVGVLRDGYACGRLTLAEFDERTTAAFASRTWGELRKLTRDLPAPGQRPPLPAAPGGSPQRAGSTDDRPSRAVPAPKPDARRAPNLLANNLARILWTHFLPRGVSKYPGEAASQCETSPE